MDLNATLRNMTWSVPRLLLLEILFMHTNIFVRNRVWLGSWVFILGPYVGEVNVWKENGDGLYDHMSVTY